MRVGVQIKLLGGFGLVLIIMLIMSLVVFFLFNQVEETNMLAISTMEDIIFNVEKEVEHLNWLNQLADAFLLQEAFTGELNAEQCDFGQWYYSFLDSEELRQTSTAFQRIFNQLEEPHRLLHETAQTITSHLQQNREAHALEVYREDTRAYIQNLQSLFGELRAEMEGEKEEALQASMNSRVISQRMLLIITCVALVIGLLAALFISRGITKPVSQLVRLAKRAGEGDLSQYSNIERSDELGTLARAFDAMIERLKGLLEEIDKSLRSSVEGLLSTSQEMAAGAQETNSSIAQITDSITHFSATVESMSSNAQSMAESASEVNDLADQGLYRMRETEDRMDSMLSSSKKANTTMKELHKATDQIGKMVGVISDVAEQTNLLALNAAIEAARAGEQGYGFAVVAEEVRQLAEETQTSVKEIEGIIKDLTESTAMAVQAIEMNNKETSAGSETLKETSASLELIVQHIRRVVEGIQDIASSSEELSAGSEEISAATEEQNASMEEISASAEQLSHMANELSDLVDKLSQ